MKKITKIILQSFLVVCLLIVALAFNFKAKAEVATTIDLTVVGAQVRTEGNAGIRFVAKYTGSETVKEYGILFALGEVEASKIELGTEDVYGASVTSQDDNNQYYVTIYEVPEAAYVKAITARAYVVLEDGSVVYATTATSKSLAEVSLKAANAGTEGTIITDVIKYVEANYKKVFSDKFDSLYIDSVAYETNYKNLASEFVTDWNKLFETTLDAETAFVVGNNNSSPFRSSACSNPISESRLYKFFTDETYGAKWGWLINFIKNETNATSNSYIKAQIEGILSKNSELANDSWYYGYHLTSYLLSIFSGVKSTTGYASYDIVANHDILGKISNYNTTVYADLSEVDIVKVGETTTLPAEISPETGYEWDGWYDGSNEYNEESSYLVTSKNVIIVPKYSAIAYTIKYFDGDTELTNLTPTTYTIETPTIALPEASKDGFVFLGWHEKSDLSDGTVSNLVSGSTGDKVYYCEWGEDFVATNLTSGSKYSTISAAVSNANKGDEIVIESGTYSENIDITIGITLTSANRDINPTTNGSSFTGENAVVLTGILSINTKSASSTTIAGLTFTGGARVFAYGNSTNFTGFVFKNNYCYNTTYTAKTWSEGGTTGYADNTSSRAGFMNIGGSYGWVLDAQYINNVFKNIEDSAIELQCTKGVTFQGNVFENIKYDAIRNNYSNAYGDFVFDGNTFKSVGYAGIYFRSYCGSYTTDSTFTIINNEFNDVANYETNPASGYVVGAICSRGYGEKFDAIWKIKYNKFVDTNHSINLRDNVTNSATWATGDIVWSCEVTYNAFINSTTPSKYQENWKSSGDSTSTNTGNFLFDNNYYGLSESKSVTVSSSQFTQILSTSNTTIYNTYEEYLRAVEVEKGIKDVYTANMVMSNGLNSTTSTNALSEDGLTLTYKQVHVSTDEPSYVVFQVYLNDEATTMTASAWTIATSDSSVLAVWSNYSCMCAVKGAGTATITLTNAVDTSIVITFTVTIVDGSAA